MYILSLAPNIIIVSPWIRNDTRPREYKRNSSGPSGLSYILRVKILTDTNSKCVISSTSFAIPNPYKYYHFGSKNDNIGLFWWATMCYVHADPVYLYGILIGDHKPHSRWDVSDILHVETSLFRTYIISLINSFGYKNNYST